MFPVVIQCQRAQPTTTTNARQFAAGTRTLALKHMYHIYIYKIECYISHDLYFAFWAQSHFTFCTEQQQQQPTKNINHGSCGNLCGCCFISDIRPNFVVLPYRTSIIPSTNWQFQCQPILVVFGQQSTFTHNRFVSFTTMNGILIANKLDEMC